MENQIRSIAFTRENALFPGNEIGAENWAMLASPVATLRAILDGPPLSDIEILCHGASIRRQASPHRVMPSRLRRTSISRKL
ncbi:hypothetical protein [Neoaquamicrobium sediminum]|uniref:hypothetical protein n=1 Tax=Neoaquamicrobium sediminum TaxID=1849104 RepID=UPI0034D3AF56